MKYNNTRGVSQMTDTHIQMKARLTDRPHTFTHLHTPSHKHTHTPAHEKERKSVQL